MKKDLKEGAKDNKSKEIRVFVANQNRRKEHKQLGEILKELQIKAPNIHFEIIADSSLAGHLPQQAVTSHPRLGYKEYRNTFKMPHRPCALNQTVQNKCKTVIKWQECAAEGVVLVGGPELYGRTLNKDVGVWINDINELLPITRKLIDDPVLRANITKKAKNHLRENGWIGHIKPYGTGGCWRHYGKNDID